MTSQELKIILSRLIRGYTAQILQRGCAHGLLLIDHHLIFLLHFQSKNEKSSYGIHTTRDMEKFIKNLGYTENPKEAGVIGFLHAKINDNILPDHNAGKKCFNRKG